MNQHAPGLTVTWFGHSAFLLESASGKRVLIDPWLDNPKAPAGAGQIRNVHIICVSHAHDDHLGSTEEIAKHTGAAVVCIHEVALHLKAKGVKSIHGINMGGSVEIQGIRVTMTDARHSSSLDAMNPPIAGGIAAGYVIRFDDGFTVYHAGDTALFGDMQLIGSIHRPDLALIPIGDYYTMGPRDAAHACKLIDPKFIIGMHYGTGPSLTGTPEQLMEYLPESLKSKLRILVPGVPQKL